jgi:DNA-binding NarL/FixJ family response regulator
VTPPFWRTPWFICLLVLIAASGAAAVSRMWSKLRAAYIRATPNVDEFIDRHGLTAREAEILHLILQGSGNKDIAAKLYISASTVRNHIHNMYQKLGVKSRIELINRISRDG